jgi:hypothetical protein
MVELAQRPAAIRVAIALISFVLFAGVVAVAMHEPGLGPGEARLHTDGVANVLSPNGEQKPVRGTVRVHSGDVVEALKGDMKLDLSDGSTVEGRPALDTHSAAAQNTKVKIAQPVEVLAGDALVTTSKGTDVDAAGNRVHLERATDGQTAARITRGLAVEAGVYHGQATLDSAGQQRTIVALRQFDVATLGRPSPGARPLQVNGGDPWDRRFLGEAMDLSDTLGGIASSYSQTLTVGEGRTVGFYRNLLPSLSGQADFSTQLLDDKRMSDPGNTLIGAAIASLGNRNGFDQRWNNVFSFRDAGAGWGLVAMDQGVASGPLLQAVEAALNGSPFPFAAAAAARAPSPSGTTGTTVGGAGGTSSTSPGSTASSSGSSGTGGSPGTPGTPGTTLPPGSPPSPTLPPGPTLPTLPPILPPPGTQPPPTGSSTGPTGNPVVDGVVNDVNNALNNTVPTVTTLLPLN